MEKNAPTSGGQGGGLMADPKSAKADMALIRRAIKARWAIPDELRAKVPQVMQAILESPASEDRDRIAAAKVLTACEAQNQADDHVADKNDRLDQGKATENVGFTVNVFPMGHRS